MNNDKLLTAEEASKLECLNGIFNQFSLYEKARRKQLPHVKIGRRIFFRESTLMQWIEETEKASVAR